MWILVENQQISPKIKYCQQEWLVGKLFVVPFIQFHWAALCFVIVRSRIKKIPNRWQGQGDKLTNVHNVLQICHLSIQFKWFCAGATGGDYTPLWKAFGKYFDFVLTVQLSLIENLALCGVPMHWVSWQWKGSGSRQWFSPSLFFVSQGAVFGVLATTCSLAIAWGSVLPPPPTLPPANFTEH